MDLQIWLKTQTNISNFETASPKPYKPLKVFISFVTTVKSRHAPTVYYLKEAEMKITMFAHFKEYHGNHES